MIKQYKKMTGEDYPYYSASDCMRKKPTSGPKTAHVSLNVKVIGKQFNSDVYNSLSPKERKGAPMQKMDWYLLSSSNQGYINNTAVTTNLVFERMRVAVGDKAFLNSEFFWFSRREVMSYLKYVASTSFFNMYNYNITASVRDIGKIEPIIFTYQITEGANIIETTIDLRRGFIGSLGLFAGFLASSFFSIWFCIGGCQRYSAEKALIKDLYTFNTNTPVGRTIDDDEEPNPEEGTPEHLQLQVDAAVRNQIENTLSGTEYVLSSPLMCISKYLPCL